MMAKFDKVNFDIFNTVFNLILPQKFCEALTAEILLDREFQTRNELHISFKVFILAIN